MTIYIPGNPVGKQRPRVANGHAYTPDKTRAYEDRVAWAWRQARGPTFNGPVLARIVAYYEIPKRTSKANREAMLSGRLRPTKKPDADNVAKAILDAISGLAFYDDAQVTSLTVQKFYDEKPGVLVTVMEEIT